MAKPRGRLNIPIIENINPSNQNKGLMPAKIMDASKNKPIKERINPASPLPLLIRIIKYV